MTHKYFYSYSLIILSPILCFSTIPPYSSSSSSFSSPITTHSPFHTTLTANIDINNGFDIKSIFHGTYFSNQGKVVFTSQGFLTFLVYDNSIISNKLNDILRVINKFRLISKDNQKHEYQMISIYNTKINNLINITQNLIDVNKNFLNRVGFCNKGNNEMSVNENRYRHLINNSHYMELYMENVKTHIKSNLEDFSEIIDRKAASVVRLRPEMFHSELLRNYIDLNKTFEIFNEYFTKNNESFFQNTSIELILSQAINAIQLNIQSVNDYVTNINNEIHKSLYGTVSHVLLPFKNFEQILKKYQDINKDVLIYPVSQKYLPSYYALSETIAVNKYHDDFIIFIIRTPLNSVPGRKFFLYKVTPFWFLNNYNLGEKIQTENRYLAVSKDKTFYLELADLSTCTFNNNIQLCIPTSGFFSIHTQPSCLSALFMKDEKDVAEICDKVLSKSFSITIIKADKGGWIISSQKSHRLTQVCSGDNHKSKDFNIYPGISYVYPQTNCRLSESSSFFMPMFDEQKQETYDYKEIDTTQQEPNDYKKLISYIIDKSTARISSSTLQYLSVMLYQRNLYDMISISACILLIIISILEVGLILKKKKKKLDKECHNNKLPNSRQISSHSKLPLSPSSSRISSASSSSSPPPHPPPPIPIPLPRTSWLTKPPSIKASSPKAKNDEDENGYMVCS